MTEEGGAVDEDEYEREEEDDDEDDVGDEERKEEENDDEEEKEEEEEGDEHDDDKTPTKKVRMKQKVLQREWTWFGSGSCDAAASKPGHRACEWKKNLKGGVARQAKKN
jgi:hypothetical protein